MRARRAALAAGALAALAVAAGVALVRSGERPAAPAAAPAPAAVAAPPPAATRGRVDPAEAPLPPLPASLAGTEVDGDLRLENGRFVAGPEALALFDYFLSATGEEPDEIIRARIVAEIRRRLPPDAAREAEALLDRYLAYREAARELFTRSDLDYADVEKRFQLVRELRREQFGAELAAALFGEEEHVVAIELERRRVLARDDLDPAERERRLAALDEELPEAVREARRAALAAVELRAAEAALRAAGASPAEIQAERERRVGPEAAARLAALDERRSAWEARVAAYRRERDALRAEMPDDAARAEALAALRDAHFAGPERVRIEALDRIEAETRSLEAGASAR